MAIKAFSDEEKAAAKAKATADFQGACMVVHLDAPINGTLLLVVAKTAPVHDFLDVPHEAHRNVFA